MMCSGVFVGGRDAADVERADLLPELMALDTDIDQRSRQVTVSLLGGLVKRTAVFRDGLGCSLAIGITPEELRSVAPDWSPTTPPPPSDWPSEGTAQKPTTGVIASDRAESAESAVPSDTSAANRLAQAVEEAFLEPDPERPRDTRALLVVHRGSIIAERYGDGFTADTPQHGWSMTKSILNALIGIRVGQGKLAIDAPAAAREWSAKDPRRQITLTNLLHMSSGLGFQESSNDLLSDVVVMLFSSPDSAAVAAVQPAMAEPGTRWAYSSGTSNLISRVLRESFTSDDDYLTFARRELFDRIGMHSALIETDPSGTFVASSFGYATARDWARFGMLYLNDGVWNGARILPEGWVTYSTTPAPAAPNGHYGSQIWLNRGELNADGRPLSPLSAQNRPWPNVPDDAFYLSGFDGQWVVVVPSHELVVVRLGRMPDSRAWSIRDFVAEVIASFVDEPAAG